MSFEKSKDLQEEVRLLEKKVRECEERLHDQKKTIDALGESEKHYRMFFENVNDGVIIHTADGHILDVNSSMYKRLGFSKKEFLKLNLQDLVEPKYANLIRERTKSLEDTGEAIFKSGDRRKDGTFMPVEVSARTITFNGEPAILSVVRDLHERKMAEDLVSAAMEEKRLLDIEIREKSKWWHQAFKQVLDFFARIHKSPGQNESLEYIWQRFEIFSAVEDRIDRTANIKKVDLQDVIRNLIVRIYNSKNISTSELIIKQEIHGIFMNTWMAFACSVMIHELVLIALHTVRLKKISGKVSFKLIRRNEKEYVLECEDSACGMNPGELETFSPFGFRLLKSTVRQLDGEIDWPEHEEKICRIRFCWNENQFKTYGLELAAQNNFACFCCGSCGCFSLDFLVSVGTK